MNELFTFFPRLFSDWTQSFETVPLDRISWFLLVLVALGGVLCALFGKKSLINRGICCTLELMVLYLTAAIVCAWFPIVQNYADLPFLSVTEIYATVISPLTLSFPSLSAALVRFLLLVFSVGLADTLIVNGQNFGVWLCTQVLSILAALLLYVVLTTGIGMLAPALLNQWSVALLIGFAVLILAFLGISMFSGEKGKNKNLHQVLSATRGGVLVSICAISFVLFLALLAYLPLMHFSAWELQQVRSAGFALIDVLCILVLCIFSILFYDRKKP